MLHTTKQVIESLPSTNSLAPIRNIYNPNDSVTNNRVMMAVESMKRHMTDEGWQIANGLSQCGYKLAGHNLAIGSCDSQFIIDSMMPNTLVVQDKREWDVRPRDFREQRARFHNVQYLKDKSHIFKLTILKDAHQKPEYHYQSAEEMGIHAWIVYYHPEIVHHLAPFVPKDRMVRTYHTIDKNVLTVRILRQSATIRKGAILSGAISRAYPLRTRLMEELVPSGICDIVYNKHPGYHMKGCDTPRYINMLTNYKVSVCTSSMYGYSLRRIIESTAAGCKVVTDLPLDDTLDSIDGNLIRIPPRMSVKSIGSIIQDAIEEYDFEQQMYYSECARRRYDFREECKRLAHEIESLRCDQMK